MADEAVEDKVVTLRAAPGANGRVAAGAQVLQQLAFGADGGGGRGIVQERDAIAQGVVGAHLQSEGRLAGRGQNLVGREIGADTPMPTQAVEAGGG